MLIRKVSYSKGLNDPPTAVGGISRLFLQSRATINDLRFSASQVWDFGARDRWFV